MVNKQRGQTKSFHFIKVCHLLLVVSIAFYLVVGAIPAHAALAPAQSKQAAGDLPVEADALTFPLTTGLTLASLPAQPAADSERAISVKSGPLQSKLRGPDALEISISDVSVTEGNSGTTLMTFIVTLSETSVEEVKVDFQSQDDTAVPPKDYTSVSGNLTIPAGDLTGSISVNINGDTIYEADETLFMVLSNPTPGWTLSREYAIGTIQNDDAVPSLSIVDPMVTEGDISPVSAPFTVTLSAVSEVTVTVQYSTTGITAQSGVDFVGARQTITFTPGVTNTIINVQVIGDVIQELDETFKVVLSNPIPIEAPISVAEAIGTILDLDPEPDLSIVDALVMEGDSGTSIAAFPVSLSVVSGVTVTVQYSSTGVTAQSDVDYIGASGTITFTPGVTNTSIDVLVIGELIDELDETFSTGLNNGVNANILVGTATGIIQDDDPPPSLNIADAQVTEGNSGTTGIVFTVTLSTASSFPITVTYGTSSGTATSGVDFQPASGQLEFSPGQTQKLVTVTVNGDTLYEYDETFNVNLSLPQNATIADGTATGTILDDDTKPFLIINDTNVLEGDSGTTNAIFQVHLIPEAGKPVTVTYTTGGGTATPGADYETTSGILTIPAGSITEYITVTVKGDTIDEFDETFNVTLSNAPSATITDATGQGKISDDDGPPDLVVTPLVNINEGDGSPINGVFTVTLSAESGKPITVTFATQDGSAIAGTNYQENHGELVFAPGELVKTITIQVTGDTICNGNSNFFVNLSNPVNANLPVSQMQGLIINDESCNMFLPAILRSLTFDDHFDYIDSNQALNNWEIVPEASATWFLLDGQYHGKHTVLDRNAKAVAKIFPVPASYSVEAKVQLAAGSDSGSRGGLLFDYLSTTQTYRFVIVPGATTGTNWMVQKRLPPPLDRWEPIQSGLDTVHINPGTAVNLLRVERVGTQIRVYANGFLLWSGTDSSYANGRAGFNIGTPADLASGEFVEVIFDDLIIGSLP